MWIKYGLKYSPNIDVYSSIIVRMYLQILGGGGQLYSSPQILAYECSEQPENLTPGNVVKRQEHSADRCETQR